MYAKIFSQIYDSSIADDWQVRVVFEDLLILANSEGIVDMTPQAICARTRIPQHIIDRALKQLQMPDPKSRTPDRDGRRLVLLDSHRSWGWQIVNYEKYRAIKCEFDRRSYMRKYMKHKRNGDSKTESLTEFNKNLTPPSPSVSGNGGVGEREVELPKGFPVTVDDAIQQCSLTQCAGQIAFLATIWNKAMSRGGRDAKECPITSFRHYAATEWTYEVNRREEKKHYESNQRNNGKSPVNRNQGTFNDGDGSKYEEYLRSKQIPPV